MFEITSLDNKTLKHIKKLWQKKYRDEYEQFVIEGVKLFDEAVAYARDSIDFVLVCDGFKGNVHQMLDGLEVKIYTAADGLFGSVCQTQSPQGILAVMRKRWSSKAVNTCCVACEWCALDFYVVLDAVSDPGNVGAVIRTSEAAGVDCVVLTDGCADIYNSKVIRAAMGSVFRMRFEFIHSPARLLELTQNGVELFATCLDGDVDLYAARFGDKVAVVVGNEARGVCDDIVALCKNKINIDMEGDNESLNVSVAAGIVLFEAKRQRTSRTE